MATSQTYNADETYQSAPQQQPAGIKYGDEPPQTQTIASGGTNTPTPPPTSQTPDYYNAQDPTHQAVWNAFQQKGIQPRDASDFNYWVDHINSSGGLANGYAQTGGTGTWADRMAAGTGGVGDYRTGGAPIQGGTSGSGSIGQMGEFNPSPYTPKPYTPSGMTSFGAGGGAFAKSLYDVLQGRAGQSLNVDPNDPAIKGQVDAYKAQQELSMRKSLAQEAEQAGPYANIGAERRSANEQLAQGAAGFQAQAIQQERGARRQEIQGALSGQMGLLTSQQQMALQEELAQLDRDQQQYQFGAGNAQQESQFRRTLANNAYQFDSNDQYRHSPLYGGG